MQRAARLVAVIVAVAAVLTGGNAWSQQAAGLDRTRAIERIAFGSCADQNLPQPIWSSVRADRPDLLLMLGDNVYGDVTSSDMGELRAAYAQLAANEGFERLRSQTPVLAIWDDHDYGGNDAGAGFVYKQRSQALFEAFWPAPHASARDRRDGIYDAVVIGPALRRVQIILLDTRFFRSPLRPSDRRGAPGRERYLADDDPAKTMLGDVQWAWLAEQLRQPAELRVLVSGVQVLADGHGWERWGNLPRERQRLFEVIAASRAGGVILLSGDRHFGALYRRDDLLPYPLHEATSSSLNRPWRDADEPGPHRVQALVAEENYGLVRIDWDKRRVALELRDLDGELLRSLDIALAELRFTD